MTLTDLLIIGGGINGTAIARDASGRGLSVVLCEKDDLARHTSSASTKLIHGGLRYLEYYEFRLVREALIEREVLLRSAPHIIWPMRFVLPYDRGQKGGGMRPQWMLRLGLFLYDNLGGRELLPGTQTVDLRQAPHSEVLESRLTTGFEYSDCWVEDARLVVLNAVDAAHRGADIRVGTEVIALDAHPQGYIATLSDGSTVIARGVVNAAGPWVDAVLLKVKRAQENGNENESGLRLIKGSHIVTRRLFPGDHAYIFQNADNRIVFAIPYERDFTLIGTTDVPWDAAPGPMDISPEETDYLCAAASEYFAIDITARDVVWSYAGVRPLYDDKSENASAVTRDYVLNIDTLSTSQAGGERPVLSIYGGKITTSRKLAEHALQKLEPFYGEAGDDWTADAQLPGGDFPADDFDGFVQRQSARYPDVPQDVLHHLCRAYGTRITLVLGDGPQTDLGRHFGAQLYEAEVRYLRAHEWARTAEAVLFRRTKQGLHLSEAERTAFTAWFGA